MIEYACENAARGVWGWITDTIGSLFATQDDFKKEETETDASDDAVSNEDLPA